MGEIALDLMRFELLPSVFDRARLYFDRNAVAVSTEPAFAVAAHAGGDPWQDLSGGV